MSLIYFNIITLVISIIIIEILRRKKNSLIIYDYPDSARKIHDKPIPLIGGPILFIYNFIIIGFLILTASLDLKLIILLSLIFSLFFLIGYFDDKNGISPLKKTILIFSVLFILLPLEQSLIVKNLEFKDLDIVVSLNQGSIFFTIFCFFFFFNLLNFSDGINGLTISICIFWLLIFSSLETFDNFYVLSLISCLVLILIYNLKNNLFLGNSGSALLSVILSCLFILQYNNNKTILCDEIFLLMFIPAIDAGRVSIERVVRGISPFKADNIHLHHLLLKKYDNKYTLLIYIILTISPFLLSLVNIKTYFIFASSIIIYLFIIIFLKKKSEC